MIFEKNPLPMWICDLERFRFLDVNDAALQHYGYTREEFLRMTIEDIGPEEDMTRLRAALRDLRSDDRLFGIWRHRKKDGGVFDVEVMANEVFLQGKRARLVLVHDVTERVRAERHRAAETAVTRILRDSSTFEEAGPKLLAAIGAAEEWSVGEIWRNDNAANLLRRQASWHEPDQTGIGDFETASAGITIAPGVGLIGRTWSNGAPIGVRDIREERGFERANAVRAADLHETIALPVRARAGVVAVLVFFGRTIREPDESLLDAMADIGNRIGQFLDRDQADTSRRVVEAAFQKAFHATPIAMAISRLADGRFVEANQQFLALFGYDRKDIIGKSSKDLAMWADPEERQVLVDRLRDQGSIRDAEIRIRTKSGEIRRTLMSVESLALHDQPTIITSLVDLTEVLAAREARARLAEIVESSELAIYGKSVDGVLTSWNPAAERLFGYTAAEAIGKPVSILVPEERKAELDRVMERVRRGERVEHSETIRIRKDGRKIVVSVTVSPIRSPDGQLIGASAITRDVTERKRAEALLRRSESRFRQLFEVAADAILLIDRQGTILDVNPAGGALLGARNPAALRGINLGEVIPPRELEKARSYLRDLLHGRPIVEPFETYIELADGERRFVHVRSRVIREEGMDPYVQVIARDVTQEKELQRRLLESERRASMGQVAAFVAHEINTPLTNIALLTASVARNITDPHLLEKLGKIDSQRRLTSSILQDLLSITRSHDIRTIHTDIRGVIEAAIEQTQGARTSQVELRKELPATPLIAPVDPLRVQQALVNVIKNAFEATARGAVTVRLTGVVEAVSIEVEDTGSGMDDEVRTRLFQPFFTTKPRGQGTGLGLVFTREVIEAHSGAIRVESTPGKGTKVTIQLPRSPGDETESSPDQPASGPGPTPSPADAMRAGPKAP